MARNNRNYYETVIQNITPSADGEGFSVMKTDRQDLPVFPVYEFFFSSSPQELVGRSVAIVTDAEQEIVKIFSEESRMVYERDDDVLNDLMELTEKNIAETMHIYMDPSKEFDRELRIDAWKKRKKKAAKVEKNSIMQEKYKNMHYDIDEELRPILGLDNIGKQLSVEEMAAVAFGREIISLQNQIASLTQYLYIRKQGAKNTVNDALEKILRKSYRRYNNEIGKYTEFPLIYAKFLNKIEGILTSEKVEIYTIDAEHVLVVHQIIPPLLKKEFGIEDIEPTGRYTFEQADKILRAGAAYCAAEEYTGTLDSIYQDSGIHQIYEEYLALGKGASYPMQPVRDYESFIIAVKKFLG